MFGSFYLSIFVTHGNILELIEHYYINIFVFFSY